MDKEYTIEEIEAANLPPDDGRAPHVPFGSAHAKWQEFKGRMRPGDKIRDFSSPQADWENLAGRAGYVLMRGDAVVGTFVTLMN